MAQQKSTNYFDPKNNPFLDPKNNPFLDPEKNPFLSADVSKMFGGYGAPELKELMDSQRKNFEALAAANKTAVEGFQAVFTRQGEILKQVMDEANATIQEAQAKGGKLDPDAAKNIDQIKDALEQAVTNMRELSEMVSKSQQEAFNILNQRVGEQLDELKKSVNK
ncbi:TIGR01841 family phasin [Marivibrio halodurans]|uniref:TIGR01841 family phasin n=1 Tax=Marivibrio halodurans TaxID=2039722 RepID=A0A8J7SPS5_9PROT|nr:TIGR01841 family phasin [Marivibrio halodurans]MBP5858813.1 TIGR01841 family phasin [Marivibrio halodurans]